MLYLPKAVFIFSLILFILASSSLDSAIFKFFRSVRNLESVDLVKETNLASGDRNINARSRGVVVADNSFSKTFIFSLLVR